MRSIEHENVYRASIGCGLRDNTGRFLYPREDANYGRFDAPPEDDDAWAYFFAKTYHGGKLSDWMQTRDSGN